MREKRLIDANAYKEALEGVLRKTYGLENPAQAGIIAGTVLSCKILLDEQPTADAVEVPCKIGDFVWAIRNIKGKKHPQRGIVSDMYFTKNMKLQIVVKYVARGEWGKTVFATDKEAYSVIGERRDDA